MTKNIASGRFVGVEFFGSPNHSDRPDPEDISLIVIHSISLPPNEYGGGHVKALFTNRLESHLHPYFDTISELKVASHLFINRQGVTEQFVSFDKAAWHAGESSFEGRAACNDYSIGIELEGTDTDVYTDAQYEALIDVVRALQAEYAISADRIVGHEDIAPGRKTDPGVGFDWARLRDALAE